MGLKLQNSKKGWHSLARLKKTENKLILHLFYTGEGLFARRDIRVGELIALYNGVRMSSLQAREVTNC
jgi:hypothetical protein